MGINGRQPTHDLCIAEKLSDGTLGRKGRIGCGWLNADGSMSVALNPGTVLDWRDNVLITLFKVEFWRRKGSNKETRPQTAPPETPPK
jgi:hypothetical protein